MSRLRSLSTVALAFLCAPAAAQTAPDGAPEAPERPTFTEHVAGIVFRHCAECHRKGEIAPFPLTSYAEVRKRGRMIARVVRKRFMPPWHPVKGHGEFEGERRLSEREIETIRRWVRQGMPQGDPARLPPMPKYPEGWRLGPPDMVVEMPHGYEVPADGPDIYRNFVIPLDLDEDKWVTAIEVKPSARSVLHHVLFGIDTTGAARRADGRDGKPGFFGMGGAQGRNLGTSTSGLGGWAVGGLARHLPMGLARKLPKGADLVLQSHFHPSGKPTVEKTKLGLYFTDRPPSRTAIGLQLPPMFGVAAGIDIPPGEKRFTIRDSFVLPVDVQVLTVGGHAHYVCKEMQVFVTRPGGDRESIFWIDDWAFNWQNRYQYKRPVELPAGTEVEVQLVYDNSADNPNNPFDPPRRIRWGLQSTDEMGSVTLLLVAREEKDTRALRRAISRHRRDHFRKQAGRLTGLLISRIKMLDHDNDGKIAIEEIPRRWQGYARRLDRDGDGVVSEQELEALDRLLGGRRGKGRNR